MNLDTRRMVNSSIGVGFAAFLARTSPPWLGMRIARFAADRIAGRKNWSMVKAVRANQWVVSGGTLRGKELDRQVQKTFRNTARSIYDLHRDILKGELLRDLAEREGFLAQITQRPKFLERGMVVVSPHLSNFDFILQAGVMLGMNALVLTISDLSGGYKQQFEMRKEKGMEILPASMPSLRKCIAYLKQGGLVLTGMDRPVENPSCRPIFFGRPSALPVQYAFMALKAHVPVVVGAVIRKQDESYKILASDPIEMVQDPDRDRELCLNAERVCRAAEQFIRLAPEQWSMSFPVWPEALHEVEGY